MLYEQSGEPQSGRENTKTEIQHRDRATNIRLCFLATSESFMLYQQPYLSAQAQVLPSNIPEQ